VVAARTATLALLLLSASRAVAAPLEDTPCKGCFTIPSATAGPRPLLVVLHGDNGQFHLRKLVRGFEKACGERGVVCVFPRCPVELRCPNGSYWQWKNTGTHDEGWLAAQIDAVSETQSIDPARVYASGYSGGGTYLGYYGPRYPRRFAAIAYISGGMPWGVPCPDCKYPVRFDIGATDPMITPYTKPLFDYYETCGGHEVVWEALRGVSHEGMLDELLRGRAGTILDWLLARPAGCLDAKEDGGVQPTQDAGREPLDLAPAPATPTTPPATVSRIEPKRGGCACSDAGAPLPSPRLGIWIGVAVLMARRLDKRSRLARFRARRGAA
jgi:predicted esterase